MAIKSNNTKIAVQNKLANKIGRRGEKKKKKKKKDFFKKIPFFLRTHFLTVARLGPRPGGLEGADWQEGEEEKLVLVNGTVA